MRHGAVFVGLVAVSCTGGGSGPIDAQGSDGAPDSAIDAPLVVDAPIDALADAPADVVLDAPSSCAGTVTGNVSITNSLELSQLSTFATVTGDLTISIPGLTSLELPCLQHLGGNLRAADSADVTVFRAPFLQDAGQIFLSSVSLQQADLSELTTVTRLLRIVGGTSFADARLGALANVGGLLSVESQNTTTPLALQLPSLLHAGTFAVGNGSYASVQANMLQTVDNLAFDGVTGITTLTLPSLIAVSSDVSFVHSSLTSVSAPALATIGGKLSVRTDLSLHSFAGFASVTSLGALSVCDGYAFTSIDMTSLTRVHGNVSLGAESMFSVLSPCGNAPLTGIGVPALARVDGDLVVYATPLTSLAGLENLTQLDGHLIIRGNTSLTTTAALSHLAAIGLRLLVDQNSALTTLGLTALRSVSALTPPTDFEKFSVTTNPQLPTCDAVASYNALSIHKPAMADTVITGNKAPTTCP